MRRLAAVLAAVAIGSAACGGSDDAPSPEPSRPEARQVNPAALVAGAWAKTLAKGSSKLVMTVTSSRGTTIRGAGAFDYRTGSGELTQTISASGRTTKQRVLLVGGIAYVSLPGAAPEKFLKVDLSSLVGRTGGGLDPSSQLALLTGATESLKDVGSEIVRGARTTHLRGNLDVDKALASIPDAKAKSGLRSLRQGLHLPERMPIDVWVDGSGVVRRLSQAYRVPAQKVLGQTVPATSGTTTVDYFDFGTPVSVKAPPASAVLGG